MKLILSRSLMLLTPLLALSACGTHHANTSKSEKSATTQTDYVQNPAQFVNPFIGTKGPFNHRQAANVVPGAVKPFGMFNFGPEHAYTKELMAESEGISKRINEDNVRIPVSPGGYNWQATRLKGFSFTRLSGTGCLGASGDVPVLPFNQAIKHSPASDKINAYYGANFSHDDETAIPGYYQVGLDSGIDVRLAATDRTGIAEFTFASKEQAKLIFRTAYSQLGSGDAFTKVDAAKGEVSGYVTSGNFCGYLGEYNRRDYYTLHFVAKIDAPITGSGAYVDDTVSPNATSSKGGTGYGDTGVPEWGKGSGLWVDLDVNANQPVTMRVGISYVSLENARENLEKEQASQSFVQVKDNAYAAWNDALGRVKVKSNDSDLLTTFYTALFHSQFHPNIFSDVNGEYRGFDQQVHTVSANQTAQYANFSGWDVYRSQLQLISLTHPNVASDIAQSLFNQANQFNGVWDRWTHNNGPTGVMSGDPSTIAIANFKAFGADKFDVVGAYQSLYKAATVPTEYDLSNVGCPVFCRGQKPSLDEWLSLNYLSDQSNSWEGASETLEQVSADFALSQLAARLGKTKHSQTLLERSSYWKNLYNPKATEQLGYIQGRNQDGSWKDKFDPFSGHLFVEGSPAQYLWMLPFDGQGLNELLGGDEVMASRLDNHFRKPDGSWVLYRDSAEYADVSNQPSIATPWMYLYTGKAYKTQQTVRETMKQLWHNTVSGIPGQDDLGQMSSWYVFSALGMYPFYPGRADMVLSSPAFEKAKIGNISISAPNASADHIYIDTLTVNGQPSMQSWINENHVNAPQHLEFTLSTTPNKAFGQAEEHRPPSFSTSSTVATKLVGDNP
ncbi:MAG: GH92 family glycosyl hydrolase [Pseudomonadota bacterium]|nr:GH92 family glycosyl hydrolase [Pseudomonadota bacterium]